MELGLYKHYKGTIYEVIGTAKHSETLEDLVIYKVNNQTKNIQLWVRPKTMFLETIFIDGLSMKRFIKI